MILSQNKGVPEVLRANHPVLSQWETQQSPQAGASDAMLLLSAQSGCGSLPQTLEKQSSSGPQPHMVLERKLSVIRSGACRLELVVGLQAKAAWETDEHSSCLLCLEAVEAELERRKARIQGSDALQNLASMNACQDAEVQDAAGE